MASIRPKRNCARTWRSGSADGSCGTRSCSFRRFRAPRGASFRNPSCGRCSRDGRKGGRRAGVLTEVADASGASETAFACEGAGSFAAASGPVDLMLFLSHDDDDVEGAVVFGEVVF